MTIFTSAAPSPHNNVLHYNGVVAPYGAAPNFPGPPSPASYNVRPPDGAAFMGSVKNFLAQFPNAFVINH